jgi:ABC-type bacteriocin/lantibiotic exporter with double-glycine peptidase domain
MNIYRGWVGEKAVRVLRLAASKCVDAMPEQRATAGVQGVEISLILGEPEDIGGFVGIAVSELVLDVGILASVFGYMFFMQPSLALVCLAIFFPQLVFVPVMQRAINRRVRSRIAVLRQASAGVLLPGAHDVEKALRQELRFAEVFQLNLGIVKLRYSMKFLMNLTHNLGKVVVLGVGGWYVIQGQAEIGMVVAFVSGLNNVRDPWGDLVNWYQDMMVTHAKYRIFAAAMEKFARGGDPLSVAASD